jgi:hypothetical protein
VELSKEVLKDARFLEENPQYVDGKPCLYVGMTGRTPDERLQQHLSGKRSSSRVRKHGRWLRRKMYERYNPMNHDEAAKMEVELANQLRNKGYAVWQK